MESKRDASSNSASLSRFTHSLNLQYIHTPLTMTQSTVDFSYLQSTLSLDQEIREQIRESTKLIDTTQRPLIALLSRVHSTPASHRTLSPSSSPPETLSLKFIFPSLLAVPQLLQSLSPLLPPLQASLKSLAALIPQQQFYRYSDSFSRSIQQSSFIIVLKAFLTSMDVPTKEEVQKELGGEGWGERMWLSTEDYLHSLISLVNELVRILLHSSLQARTDIRRL